MTRLLRVVRRVVLAGGLGLALLMLSASFGAAMDAATATSMSSQPGAFQHQAPTADDSDSSAASTTRTTLLGNAVGPGKLRSAAKGAARGIRAAKDGTRTLDAILDATGKVHGPLPKPADLGKYDPEDLARLRDELQQSVQKRIEKTVELGADYGHSDRLAQEQALMRSIEKHLADR